MPALPNDFKQTLTIAKFEAGFDSWRSVLGNISLVALASAVVMVMIAFSPVIVETPESFAASFLFLVFILAPLAAVIFAANNVTSEFEGKTGRVIFTNPVKRSVLAAGKFMASLFYVGWAILIFYLGCAVATFHVFGTVPAGIVGSFVLAILYGSAVLALTFLFCFLFRNGMLAGVTLFSILFLGMPLIQILLNDVGYTPWYLLTHAAASINAFGGLSAPSLQAFFGRASSPPDPLLSGVVMAVYSVVLFGLSVFVFKRKDIL